MSTATWPLQRTDIRNIDHAMYAASCFAGAVENTVTIMQSIVGREEHYQVLDGRQGPFRDNGTGMDWEPVYFIERAPEGGPSGRG